LEPNPVMIRLAELHRRQTDLKIQFLDLPGERIPLEDRSVDTVVSTFTLCTIPGVVDAIRGIGRVLRPGGKFIFFEHGLSPDPPIQRWQKWSEPIPPWLFERLSRNTRHPVSHHERRFSNGTDGNGVPSAVPEVVDLLFLGHRDTTITIAQLAAFFSVTKNTARL